MSMGWVDRAAWKAWAVPAKLPRMLVGMPIRRSAAAMAATASPRATPGARLKYVVTAGKSPWWLIWRGAGLGSNRVSAVRGTDVPVADWT